MPYAGSEGGASSVTALAEELSAFLKSGGVAERGSRPTATVQTLRAQLLAITGALFEHGQLGLAPGLAALAGPLQDDPALQFLQARAWSPSAHCAEPASLPPSSGHTAQACATLCSSSTCMTSRPGRPTGCAGLRLVRTAQDGP